MTIDPKEAYNRIIELSLELEEEVGKGEVDLNKIFIRSVDQGETAFVPKEKTNWFSRGWDRLRHIFKGKVKLYDLKSNLEEIHTLFQSAASVQGTRTLREDLKEKLTASFKGDANQAIQTLQDRIVTIGQKAASKKGLTETTRKITDAAKTLMSSIDAAKKEAITEQFSERVDKCNTAHQLIKDKQPDGLKLAEVSKHLNELQTLRDTVVAVRDDISAACKQVGIDGLDILQTLEQAIKDIDTAIPKFETREQQLQAIEAISIKYCQCPGAPKNDRDALAILEAMKGVCDKAFFLVQDEDYGRFILHYLEEGKTGSKNLSIEAGGKCLIIDPDQQHSKEFASFDDIKRLLGEFALKVLIDSKKEQLLKDFKVEVYPDVHGAEVALRGIVDSDAVAKTMNSFIVWNKGDELNQEMHILAYKSSEGRYVDYAVDLKKYPGKIWLKVTNGFGEGNFDELRLGLGIPAHELQDKLTEYSQKQKLYQEFQQQSYSYGELAKQGVAVESSNFTDLQDKLMDKFHKVGGYKSQYLFVSDDEIPAKANLTLIRYVPAGGMTRLSKPEKIQMDRVLIDSNGIVTLQPIDAEGNELMDEKSDFPGGSIEELGRFLENSKPLKQLIDAKMKPLDRELINSQKRLTQIQQIIQNTTAKKPLTYDSDKIVSIKTMLESLKTKVQKQSEKSGVTWKDPEIIQQIEKEIEAIKFRIEISGASKIFKDKIASAKTYSDLNEAHLAMKMALSKSKDCKIPAEEILQLAMEHSEIENQRAQELFYQELGRIPDLQKEWLTKCSDVSELAHRQLELRATLHTIKHYVPAGETHISVLQAIKSLEYVDRELTNMLEAAREAAPQVAAASRQEAHGGAGQLSGLMISGNGTTINVYNGTPGAHQTEVASSVSEVASSILSPQSIIGMITMGTMLVSGGLALPVAAGISVAASIMPVAGTAVLRKYASPQVANFLQPFLYFGTSLLFHQYLIPALRSPAAAPQAVVPQPAAAAAQPSQEPSSEAADKEQAFIDIQAASRNVTPAVAVAPPDGLSNHMKAMAAELPKSDLLPSVEAPIAPSVPVQVPSQITDEEALASLKGPFQYLSGSKPYLLEAMDYMWGTELAKFDASARIVGMLPGKEKVDQLISTGGGMFLTAALNVALQGAAGAHPAAAVVTTVATQVFNNMGPTGYGPNIHTLSSLRH